MEDRRNAVDRAVEYRFVAHIPHETVDRQSGEIVVVALRLAERPDLVALGQERAHDRRPDEAGRPGDEGQSG